MAATAGLKHCVTCGREKTTFRCGGCLQEFCFNHLNDHQKELSKQLQEVEVTCDRLRQTLNEDTTDSQKYALIEQINDWEREAIKKIQQAAEEERQKLLKYKIEHKIQIEADLNKLTDELRQSREDNDFHETHLNRWNEELRKLREELAKPLNTDLQLGSTLINKIFLDITSDTPSVSNLHSSTDGSSQRCNSFCNDNKEENNNSNSGGGFSSRNSDDSSIFGARNGRNGFGGDSRTFGSSNDNNSREYYNYNKTGHMIRECPEPRKQNRGAGSGRGGFNTGASRGGFNSSGGDCITNLTSWKKDETSSISVTVRNTRNQNGDDQDGNSDAKPAYNSWRSNTSTRAASNGNDSEDFNRRTTFNSSATRGGFNSGGGFRGGRGRGRRGFSSGDRDNYGDGGNCYKCNRPGHQSRDCPEERKPRDGGSNGFFSGGSRRNDGASDDIFDQNGGRASTQPTENYIPPPPPTIEDDIFGEAIPKGENFGKYHQTPVQCIPSGKIKPIELYEEANLDTQILLNIRRAHFEEPTLIQRYTIPCIRQQDDLMACAQTGTGKTAAFLLPIISNLLEYHLDELAEKHHPPSPLFLILSPTRELALQTEREAIKFAYQTDAIPSSVVGGHDTFSISDRLRKGCHILSATTGRLKLMIKKGRVSLKQVKYFVLDEADRMSDPVFEADIHELEDLGLPPKDERFTSLFSTTFSDAVEKLANHLLRKNYIFLSVGTLGGANRDITQTIEKVRQANKRDRLCELLEQNLKSERCLIFVETSQSADYIGAVLTQKQLMCATIHRNRTQQQRTEALQQFTNGECPILVATSVADGLDFPLIGYVVNYDLPYSIDFYIHLIGRTGRAGHLGKSISFFDPDRQSDRKIAPDLISKLSEAGQEVPEFLKEYADGSNDGDYGGQNTDTRPGLNSFGSRNLEGDPSDGTASADATDDGWD